MTEDQIQKEILEKHLEPKPTDRFVVEITTHGGQRYTLGVEQKMFGVNLEVISEVKVSFVDPM
jgi:hypothetical protein